MYYGDFTEEALITKIRGGEKGAEEELLYRYKSRVLAVARKFFLVGGDTDDLVQAGMMGLFSAMNSYEGEPSGFPAYAHTCIKNRIMDAVKGANSAKNAALNGSSPLTAADAQTGLCNPLDKLIDDEDNEELAQKIKAALSEREYRIFRMYADGAPMSEISSSLNLDYRQVDNAVMRAKKKLYKLFA